MLLTDAELIALLDKAAGALDAEAAFVVDVDVDGHGRSKPIVPARDRLYFDALCESGQALRELIEMLKARRRAA